MRREAEGYRRQTDLNSWSPLRFTVSLPRLTKWVTHGRVPSLISLQICLISASRCKHCPAIPHQYSLSA